MQVGLEDMLKSCHYDVSKFFVHKMCTWLSDPIVALRRVTGVLSTKEKPGLNLLLTCRDQSQARVIIK